MAHAEDVNSRASGFSRVSQSFCWATESLTAWVGPDRQDRSPTPKMIYLVSMGTLNFYRNKDHHRHQDRKTGNKVNSRAYDEVRETPLKMGS